MGDDDEKRTARLKKYDGKWPVRQKIGSNDVQMYRRGMYPRIARVYEEKNDESESEKSSGDTEMRDRITRQ